MDNTTLSMGRRVLSAVVATLTIVWAAGAAAFAVPQMASAASAGDLIRGTSFSTVYFYGYDGSRYIFPNEKTYDTWFNGFSGVQTISDSAVAAIPVAGNVVYRPGSRWIKIDTAAQTYAVATDGTIHWVETEAVANGLAGSDWNQNIDDVPDAFFDNYTEGVSLTSATVWDGALYMDGGNYYISWDGEKRMLTSAARSANHLENRFFLDGASINDSALSAGSDITGALCVLMNAAQAGNCESQTTPVGGNVSVSVASNTASATLVPDTATGFSATSWTLNAAQASTLDSLTVSLGGLANTTDISNVYLYEGNARLTDGRSFNSSTRTATFAGLNLAFAAGQTRTLTAVVDMADAGGNRTFQVGIAAASAVGTNGSVSGSFPAWGNAHTTSEVTVGEISVERTGSLTNPAVGTQDAIIARFKMSANTAEDTDVKAITLEIKRAADHSDFRLFQGTTQVATGTSIGKDLVLFTFNSPYLLEKGASRNFHVTADVGGKIDETIQTYLRNDADVRATGRDFNFGVSIANTYTFANRSNITIEGGKVTLSFVGPNDSDVRIGAKDHTFLEFSLTAQEWAEVDEVTFTVAHTDGGGGASDLNDAEAPLRNFRVINAATGSILAGSLELSTAGNANSQTLRFTDNFYVNAGETIRLAVIADIDSNAAEAADVFTVSLANTTTHLVIENADRDAITDIVPASGVAGKNQTLIDAGLTLTLANTPNGSVNAVRGAQNIEVAAFNFEASQGDDINVTDLNVTVQGIDDGGALTTTEIRGFVSACSVVDRSNNNAVVAGPRSVNTSGVLDFSSFSWTIEGGQDRVLAVRCNFADTAIADNPEVSFRLLTGAVTAVEATTGDSVTAETYPVNGANHAAASVDVALLSAGTLAVAVDASRPDAQFVLSGSNDNSVSTFRFDATNEPFNVKTLTFVDSANATGSPISSVTITYPREDGTTGTRTATLVGAEARFQNLDMYVERNAPARVYAKVNVAENRRDNGFADSNDRVQLEIAEGTAGNDKFEAVGVGSSATDKTVDATTTSRRHVVRETVPTVAKASTSPSGALFNGTLPVYTVNVAASATEDVVWDGAVFELSGSGIWNACTTTVDVHNLIASDISLERVAGSSRTSLTDVSWTLFTSALAVVDAGDCATVAGALPVKYVRLAFDAGAGEVIPAGTTRTFEVTFDVSGALEGDSLQVSIPAESALYGASSTATTLDGAVTTTTATAITLADAGSFSIGTIMTVGDERMLVVSKAGAVVTVIRGYAGTTATTHLTGANAGVTLSTFVWQDDGTQSRTDNTAVEAAWGSYLVQNLPARGNTLVW